MRFPVCSVTSNSVRIPKYIDIAKTSRQLFCSRPFVLKLQAFVLFYSVLLNKSGHRKPAGEEGIRRAMTAAPIVSGSLVSVLDRKSNRGPSGGRIMENGVLF